MSIIQAIKTAETPKTANFVKWVAHQQWSPDDISAACVYAAANNYPHVFSWAYAQLPITSHLDKEVLIAASHKGHSFVLDQVCTTPILCIDPKILFINAADKGHLDFIRTLHSKVKLSDDDRERMLIQAARKGHCVILNEYATTPVNKEVVHLLFRSAAQNGHINVLKWLEGHSQFGLYQQTERCFQNVSHEAVANAHPELLEYVLEDPAWSTARAQMHARSFDQHLISNLNVLLRISQKSEKKHATAFVLARHLPLQKWEESQRFINPWHKEYLETVYSAHQKMLLEKAVGASLPSEKTRRKM